MGEDHIEEIFEYFKDSQTDNIHAAIKELGSDFTEEEIRLVRIKFISEMGNWKVWKFHTNFASYIVSWFEK